MKKIGAIPLLAALYALVGCVNDSSEPDPFTGKELSVLVPQMYPNAAKDSITETIQSREYSIRYNYACDTADSKNYNRQLVSNGWDDDEEEYGWSTSILYKSKLKKNVNGRDVVIKIRCSEFWDGKCNTSVTIGN